jgi:hypothetical protein
MTPADIKLGTLPLKSVPFSPQTINTIKWNMFLIFWLHKSLFNWCNTDFYINAELYFSNEKGISYKMLYYKVRKHFMF